MPEETERLGPETHLPSKEGMKEKGEEQEQNKEVSRATTHNAHAEQVFDERQM